MNVNESLFQFIKKSPTMFHAVETLKEMLLSNGFTELPEYEKWEVKKGGKYFTTRNHSSLIAFSIGEELDDYHFQMTAAHGDSPMYKVKNVAELSGPSEYLRLNVEGYGGMIDSSWFDKPLSLAGRVLVETENGIESRLLHMDEDLFIIPNVAIHFNREINSGYKYNRQIDLCPLFSTGELKAGAFDQMIADTLQVDVNKILSKDLFMINRQEPTVWGYKKEFISSGRLDDLQCSFAACTAFMNAKDTHHINVFCNFDNEEVGSGTKQGALSTFLFDTLQRLNHALHKTEEDYYLAVSKSFMVSCDNAHAVHPNHPEKTDHGNCAYMNKGLVIKESANQKYTTDAFSRAVLSKVLTDAGVPYQTFSNRSDMIGGSTLGNLSDQKVSCHTVDIGLPQLAMHSSYETAGSKDTETTIEGLTAFYSKNIRITGAESVVVE